MNLIFSERFKEIVRFCFVGGLSLLVDMFVLFGLTEWFGVHYLYSAGISFTVSVIFNYWLCVKFVFKIKKKQTPKQATIFIGSSIIGLGLNQICMWFFVEIILLHYMIAKLGATLIVTAWNYVMKRKAISG